MTNSNNVFQSVNNSFAAFTATEIEVPQLSFIKGGEDLDGDGIDDETNGVVGTVDVVGF